MRGTLRFVARRCFLSN